MRQPGSAKIDEALSRGVAEVVDRAHLHERLTRGDVLRVKLGIDPTGTQLHLGHAVPLRILRRFQDLGHVAVLIIGDFTATIGDPTGRNETRPPLTSKDIARNLATYEKQALKILDRRRLEFRWQSEWFDRFTLKDVIREASKLSAGWVLSHETFRDRVRTGRPLAFHELLYPLLQAYDSLAVKADVELGGLDQKFNILTGRELMKAHGAEPQDVVLAKYLVGTDGQKMGKSLGNFIALEEEPFEMFGKIMSMPDTVLRDYFELATSVPMDEIGRMQFTDIAARDAKLKLAEAVVEMYHGRADAMKAKKRWNDFLQGTAHHGAVVLRDIPHGTILEFLAHVRLATSKSEAQRLVKQGGCKVNGKVIRDWKKELKPGDTITVGKKKITLTISS